MEAPMISEPAITTRSSPAAALAGNPVMTGAERSFKSVRLSMPPTIMPVCTYGGKHPDIMHLSGLWTEIPIDGGRHEVEPTLEGGVRFGLHARADRPDDVPCASP